MDSSGILMRINSRILFERAADWLLINWKMCILSKIYSSTMAEPFGKSFIKILVIEDNRWVNENIGENGCVFPFSHHLRGIVEKFFIHPKFNQKSYWKKKCAFNKTYKGDDWKKTRENLWLEWWKFSGKRNPTQFPITISKTIKVQNPRLSEITKKKRKTKTRQKCRKIQLLPLPSSDNEEKRTKQKLNRKNRRQHEKKEKQQTIQISRLNGYKLLRPPEIY